MKFGFYWDKVLYIYPMDPESPLYIMSALAHQKYTLSDRSFRAIKHNTVPWNLFFNKRSGAVVMSPVPEGLDAAVVAGVGSSLTVQWYFIFPPQYTFFWSTFISIDPGPEFFVEICLNLKL